MWHAVNPKELVRLTLVCKNWRDELRKDEYWYRFRNAILTKLPTLGPLFSSPPPSAGGKGGKPLWYIFTKRIWPVAANLQKSSMQIYKLNYHILLSIIIAFNPESEFVIHFETLTRILPHVFGGLKICFAGGNITRVLFSSVVADQTLIKQLGVKRAKISSEPHVYARIRCRNNRGELVKHCEMSVKEFFLPFLKIVFPKA
jgi:hypothetical protein